MIYVIYFKVFLFINILDDYIIYYLIIYCLCFYNYLNIYIIDKI